MTYKAVTVRTLKADTETRTLLGLISNQLEVSLEGSTALVAVVIPTEWLYFISIIKLHPDNGEVRFILRDGDTPKTFDICYAQGTDSPIHINTEYLRDLAEHKWIFF